MQDLARQGLVMALQQRAVTYPWCWGPVFEYSKVFEGKTYIHKCHHPKNLSSDILPQLWKVQASILWDHKRAVQALCNGVGSTLEASDLRAHSVDELEP
ncbi:unnamed protein product [Penicillium roqueforti FM164]|uniref:Genomic scaffold, ProqFM164S02 n=1 Tax=Penicillium roqueforti (strain FM164) TaxID=1365484 RepID=W6QEI9_PENRF|nr:unnamed protein product [Penicillium roqueforti FM164]